MFWENFKKPHLIAAHRGNRYFYPENTLIAFEHSKNCDFIEFDIQMTKDEEIVIIHDETPKRTSTFNTNKKIKELTLKELKEHNFGNNIYFQKIPTLEEALKIIKKPINIEIKSKDMNLEKLLFLIKGRENKIIFSSFHHYHLKNLKKLNKNISITLLDEIKRKNILDYLKEFDTNNYNISKEIATKDYIRYLKKHNINISVFTVNKKEKIKSLFKLGVKAVFKDKC